MDGALHIELNADYGQKGIDKVYSFAKSKTDRYFEFKSRKALDNISFFDYDPKKLANIKSKYNFDKIEEIIKKDKKFAIRLLDDDMKLFAHLLFDKGYMTGENDCFGGTLEYVDRNKSKR